MADGTGNGSISSNGNGISTATFTPTPKDTLLITGGAGYVGSHTVRHLLEQHERVVVLDNLVFGHRETLPPDSDRVFGEEIVECVVRADYQVPAGVCRLMLWSAAGHAQLPNGACWESCNFSRSASGVRVGMVGEGSAASGSSTR